MKKRLLLLAVAFVAVAGCSRNNIYIDLGDKDSEKPDPNITSLVRFHASVESTFQTKYMTPIAKSNLARLYAYPSNDVSARGDAMARGAYEAQSAGVLVGIGGYEMEVPNGKFNLYGVSLNTKNSPPNFYSGVSEPLINGVDYLWWGVENYDVSGSSISVPIVFSHAATQVSFVIEAGSGMIINKIVKAYITTPQTGATMDLSTGIIASTTQYGDSDIGEEMGVMGSTIQKIMLPIKTGVPTRLTLIINSNFDPDNRTYRVPVPIPDGELKAGRSYQFRAVIDATTITFPNVSINHWIDVDEKEKPLYPR